MMSINSFFYRQGQRINYHISRNPILKRIAEINQNRKVVLVCKEGYEIDSLGILLPREQFDFVLQRDFFELFLKIPKILQGQYRLVNNKLLLEFDDLKLHVASKSELYIINEIFVDKCYQFLLPNNESTHVIDIGMNVGLASLFFAGLPFVKKVHAYEPFQPTFRQAMVNLAENPKRAAKIETFNFGLGKKEDQVFAVYDSENSGINTSLALHSISGTFSREAINIKPAFETLNSVFDLYPDETFVLKIDTEGAEYLIFESLFKQKLSRQVRGILLEWHFNGAKPLEDALVASGFTLTSFPISVNSGLIYAFR